MRKCGIARNTCNGYYLICFPCVILSGTPWILNDRVFTVPSPPARSAIVTHASWNYINPLPCSHLRAIFYTTKQEHETKALFICRVHIVPPHGTRDLNTHHDNASLRRAGYSSRRIQCSCYSGPRDTAGSCTNSGFVTLIFRCINWTRYLASNAMTQYKKLHGLSPRANYTDRATAACQRSDCQLLRIKGATWSAWRIPTAVFSVL
jgi:hypothetical protein